MADHIAKEQFTNEVYDIFRETFEQVQGIFLDRGTSLFETLATISAEEASRPVSASCASIAAQVEHVRFYIDVLEGYILGTRTEAADWDEIWRTVQTVSTEEWAASCHRLKASYERVLNTMKHIEIWEADPHIGGALAIVVHTAYHLGEIRQALCFIKAS
jgi:hypothetical protein